MSTNDGPPPNRAASSASQRSAGESGCIDVNGFTEDVSSEVAIADRAGLRQVDLAVCDSLQLGLESEECGDPLGAWWLPSSWADQGVGDGARLTGPPCCEPAQVVRVT